MKPKVAQIKLLQPPKIYGGAFQELPVKIQAMLMTGRLVAGIVKEAKSNEKQTC